MSRLPAAGSAFALLALGACSNGEVQMRLTQSGENCIAHIDGERFNYSNDEDDLAAHLRNVAPSATHLRITTFGLVPYRCIGEAEEIARAEGFMDIRSDAPAREEPRSER